MVPHSGLQCAIREFGINWINSEPYSPWQNCAENLIGLIKGKWKRGTVRWIIQKNCWSFVLVWEPDIYSCTSYKDGTTGMELITSDTIDIIEWTKFGYYDLSQYWYNQNSKEIGRWLGVSCIVGSLLCYWILASKGKVIASTTVQHVTNYEAATHNFQKSIGHYHKCSIEYLVKEIIMIEIYIGLNGLQMMM